MRSLYTGHAASGLPNPTHLEGEGVRYIHAQDQLKIATKRYGKGAVAENKEKLATSWQNQQSVMCAQRCPHEETLSP